MVAYQVMDRLPHFNDSKQVLSPCFLQNCRHLGGIGKIQLQTAGIYIAPRTGN
jgi:hypothetical protein